MGANTQTALTVPDQPGVQLVFSKDQSGQLWVTVQHTGWFQAFPISVAQMQQIAAAATAAVNG